MTVEAEVTVSLRTSSLMGVLLRLSAVALLAILLGWASAARARDPAIKITQYGHRAWRIGEAGLDSSPTSIAQTSDGDIWVGTTNGLYRFDGKQFIQWRPTVGAPVNLGLIDQLFGARNGDLYVGARAGLFRVSHGTYFKYPVRTTEPGPFVEDDAGTIWFKRTDVDSIATICSAGRSAVRCYGRRDGLQCKNSLAAALTIRTALWIGDDSGICEWKPGTESRFYSLGNVNQIASDPHGSLWASVRPGRASSGLLRFDNGRWKRFTVPGFDSRRLQIWTLLEDRNGSVWFGGNDLGLYRIADGQVDHIDHSDGLTSDSVSYAMEDREGSIWITTQHGVDQFFRRPITPFTVREGLAADAAVWVTPMPDESIAAYEAGPVDTISEAGAVSRYARTPGNNAYGPLLADGAGRVWVSPAGKLFIIDRAHMRRVPLGDDTVPYYANSLAEDTRHAVWVGGRTSTPPIQGWLTRIDHDGQVHRVPPPLNGRDGVIDAIASDLTGGLWVAALKGRLFHWQDGRFDRVPSLSVVAAGRVRQILPVALGEAWLATQHGAAWMRDGRVHLLNAANGLPCDVLYGIALDRAGSLWMTTPCGLVEVPAAELNRWQRQPGVRIRAIVFDAAAGYNGDETSRLVRSNGGKLWFAGGFSVYEVDPAHIAINRMAPPLQIQGVAADQRSVAVAPRIILPKLTRNLEIDYAAFSYLQPDLLDYHYRLFGHDREWTDVGNRRQAFYNDLPPGSYRFQVTACNEDGICNRRGASIILVIPPAWWQTWWFRTLCVALMLVLIAAAARWRLNAYAKSMRLRFDDRLEERTRVARDLHDTMMQTVLASKLLAEGGQTINTVPEGRAVLTRLSEWLGSAADEGRAAVRSLRSSAVETNHLAGAFEVAALEGRTDREPETHIDVTGEVRELHPIVRDEIHRIGVEAIRNARAHSGASHILVAIDYDHSLTVRIRDDGHGMDDDLLRGGKAGHFGLVGMRERAEQIGAKLTVSSSTRGTEISLVVPGKAAFVGRPGPARSFVRFWSRRSERRA